MRDPGYGGQQSRRRLPRGYRTEPPRNKTALDRCVMAECEGDWTILDMRHQSSDSPGSDDWTELLCCRALKEGVEFAICGYEFDHEGDETDEIGCNSDTFTVSQITSDTVASALDWLEWKADEVLILDAIPRQ